MIDLHYWPTPNGWKISIMLEECALPYRLVPVNIGRGVSSSRRASWPSAPTTACRPSWTHAPLDGGEPLAVFESGAILQYLAGKGPGRFLPTGTRERFAVLQWLMWQIGRPGSDGRAERAFLCCTRPTKSPTPSPATARRWTACTACWTRSWRAPAPSWPAPATRLPTWPSSPGCARTRRSRWTWGKFPHVQAWYDALFLRPAVKRGLDLGKELRAPALTDEARKNLFGQTAQSVRQAQEQQQQQQPS